MLEIVVLSPVDFEISLLFSCRSLFAFFFQKESRSALTLHMKLITCKETPVFLFWGFAEAFDLLLFEWYTGIQFIVLNSQSYTSQISPLNLYPGFCGRTPFGIAECCCLSGRRKVTFCRHCLYPIQL
nr:uncharacterized protein LOC103421826 isoform X2 [Malus domestica]